MKQIVTLIGLGLIGALTLQAPHLNAQPVGGTAAAMSEPNDGTRVTVSDSGFAATGVASSTPSRIGGVYSVIERGPHHRVWERLEYEPAPDGRQIPRPHRYIELATGMHYWDGSQWKESQELIEAYPGGAVARHGQHKVIFTYNLATLGAIDMELPDGNRLRSHVLGLSYFDTASGKNVLIAGVKDCTGVNC